MAQPQTDNNSKYGEQATSPATLSPLPLKEQDYS